MLDPEYLADILTSPVCSCHNDCSGFWSRELWKRMHEPILEYTQNCRSFIKWMHCYIMTSFWNADTNSFQFSVGGRDVCPVAFCAFWHLTRYMCFGKKIDVYEAMAEGEGVCEFY